MTRRAAMTSAGIAALSAVALSAAPFSAAHAGPAIEPEQVIVVDQQGDALVAQNLEQGRDPLVAKPHGRWAIGVAIGTLLAGLVSLVGFNGVLRMVTQGGQAAANAMASAAEIPAKAIKSAAKIAAKTLKTPGKWLLGTSLVAVGLVATVLVLDVQWKAGLAVGAATTIAGLFGTNRVRRVFARNTQTPNPPHSPSA